MMPETKCRVCGQHFHSQPLLKLSGMPKSAQNFPDRKSVKKDHGVDLNVFQCSGCGLVQLADRPVPYYREVIRAAAISDVVKDFKTRQFSSFIRKHALKNKRIIEIGCGNGEFLALLNRLPVQAYGLEHSRAAVSKCLSKGLKVSMGYLDKKFKTLPDAPYDAFLLLMFLEHMPSPNTCLKVIHSNLSDSGVGIVEVPNLDMMLEKNLFSEFISDHLLYFTKKTLETCLNLNGFEILDISEIRDSYVISVTVRKRTPLDISHFTNVQNKITREINEFIDRFGKNQVAIWGAGHQALAIITLANIKDKIRYVVDGAPFKQGKLTPASHLPVVQPSRLRQDSVEAIIVMAASYSDEIVELIRKKHRLSVKLAVMRDNGLEILTQ